MPHLTPKMSYRYYFIFLFLAFGIIIALLTSLINYNFDIQNIQLELDKKANVERIRKYEELSLFTERLERYVASLRNSSALQNYIRQPDEASLNIVQQLFYTISSTNPTLMQVRFLDTHGMEEIRIDWDTAQQWPNIIQQKELQDKSQRYYFIEASQDQPNSFWYSKLDLNVEHKKIEIPYKPVLRVASPVYVDQQFRGIVIINVHAKSFLERFKKSPFFNVVLVDHDGHYLTHFNDKRSWSRYLDTGHTLTDDFPDLAATILRDNQQQDLISMKTLYAAPLDNLLTKDKARLVLIPKNQYIQVMKHERKKAMLLIIGTILLLTIPLSILISRVPAKLNQKIAGQNTTLQEYVDLIDNNIITATTNTEGIITEISTAFCRISGFSKEDVIGQKPRMFQHPGKKNDVKLEVWKTIQAGRIWLGEFHNQSRNGHSYWLDATVFPKLNDQNTLQGYTAIYQDITDKKRIEKLSITDVLTGLYNRRFFDETIKKELRRAIRDKKMLTFTMLDVDFFKQYNDHYGHQKGDEVLSAIGQVLQHTLCRSSDFCFRLGGEEFGILFSDLSIGQSYTFTENIRKAIEELAIEHQWNSAANVITASFGLLSVAPIPGITVDTIYQRADRALYQAKKTGRNRTFSDSLDHPS